MKKREKLSISIFSNQYYSKLYYSKHYLRITIKLQ